jgi:hypothetical protein
MDTRRMTSEESATRDVMELTRLIARVISSLGLGEARVAERLAEERG